MMCKYFFPSRSFPLLCLWSCWLYIVFKFITQYCHKLEEILLLPPKCWEQKYKLRHWASFFTSVSCISEKSQWFWSLMNGNIPLLMPTFIVIYHKYLLKNCKIVYLIWNIHRIIVYNENFSIFEVNLICTIKEIFYAFAFTCLDVNIPFTKNIFPI